VLASFAWHAICPLHVPTLFHGQPLLSMASLAVSWVAVSFVLTKTPVAATLTCFACGSGAAVASAITLVVFRRRSAAPSSKSAKTVSEPSSYDSFATMHLFELMTEAEEEHVRRLMEMQAEVKALKLDVLSSSDGDSTLDTQDSVIQTNPNAETSHVLRAKLEFAEAEHAAALEHNLMLQAKNDELEERARNQHTDSEVLLCTLCEQLNALSDNTEFRLQNLQHCVQVLHKQLTHSQQQIQMLTLSVCVTNVEHPYLCSAEEKAAQAKALIESCSRERKSEQHVLAVCQERDALQNQLEELGDRAKVLQQQKDLAQAEVAALEEELSHSNCGTGRSQENFAFQVRVPTDLYTPDEHIPDESIPHQCNPNKHIPDQGIPDEVILDESIPDEFVLDDGIPERDLDRPSVNIFYQECIQLPRTRMFKHHLNRGHWVQNLSKTQGTCFAHQQMVRCLG